MSANLPIHPFLSGGALVLALAASATSGAAQQAPQNQPFGPLAIHGYELREARHARPIRMIAPGGGFTEHAWSWQIVIRGESFPIRALDPILWVDDVPLTRFERRDVAGEQEIAYDVVDPTLLRAERTLQMIYGGDERTRTKLLERLDPEKLVKLPEDQRKELGIADLEGVQLQGVDAAGRVSGRGRLSPSSGTVRLAARGEKGGLTLLAAKVALGADGSFAVDAGRLPAGTTHVVALLFTADVALAGAEAGKLPKGIELLDSKPVGTKPGGR